MSRSPDGASPGWGCGHLIAAHWLADLQRTVYPHKWSTVSCRSSAGQGKFAGQRPTFYHCATQPTLHTNDARQPIRAQITVQARKDTRPHGVDNNAFARPPSLNLSLTSCDLDLWSIDPERRLFYALTRWTTCANLHQKRFFRFQNNMFTTSQVW